MHIRYGLILAALLAALSLGVACDDDDDAGGSATSSSGPPAAATQGSSGTPAGGAHPTAVTGATGTVVLNTTTSTQDSGLLDVLVPMFQEESGYTVETVAVESEQAIEQASRGDADVVLAHSPAAEQEMVADGDGIERALVMHDDFVIVGPAGDPADLTAQETLDDLLRAIAEQETPFVSRGDDSDAHALEMRLWESVDIDPTGESWYTETGQGMTETLQAASRAEGYTLSDRATFLAQQANLGQEIIFRDDPRLLNVYHVIVVNPEKHGDVNAAGARAFAAFITRPDIQDVIGEFGVEEFGEPLFFPDAGEEEPSA